ncbi:MAG: hypothetical protein HKN23_11380 [Verrucomicrobiales bacterium]|nr:hypothetical protein [Verrucomicrobiales bacterium]
MSVSRFYLVLFSGFALALPVSAIDYKTDVLPIMKEHCWKCHSNEEDVKGNLALDDLEEMRDYQVGKFNIIRPGNPEESSFLEKMKLPPGDTDFMPRKGEPLPKKKIEIIEKWIAEGAIIDSKNLAEKEAEFLKEKGETVDAAMVKKPDETFYKWTDSLGRELEARFMGLTENKPTAVKLLLRNGKNFNYPLSMLSEESRAQAKKLGGEE